MIAKRVFLALLIASFLFLGRYWYNGLRTRGSSDMEYGINLVNVEKEAANGPNRAYVAYRWAIGEWLRQRVWRCSASGRRSRCHRTEGEGPADSREDRLGEAP